MAGAATTRLEIKRFVEELGLGKINKGKRLCDAAQFKVLKYAEVSLEFFNKQTDQISITEIGRFEKPWQRLDQSTLKNKPYDTYESRIRSMKIFLALVARRARGRELAGWLDTRDREKTPDT